MAKSKILHDTRPDAPIQISAYIHCGMCLAEQLAEYEQTIAELRGDIENERQSTREREQVIDGHLQWAMDLAEKEFRRVSDAPHADIEKGIAELRQTIAHYKEAKAKIEALSTHDPDIHDPEMYGERVISRDDVLTILTEPDR